MFSLLPATRERWARGPLSIEADRMLHGHQDLGIKISVPLILPWHQDLRPLDPLPLGILEHPIMGSIMGSAIMGSAIMGSESLKNPIMGSESLKNQTLTDTDYRIVHFPLLHAEPSLMSINVQGPESRSTSP